MAKKSKWRESGRDGSRYLALPHVVLNSPAYISLGFSAVKLLLDIGAQYNGSNNGKLVAAKSYLGPRGWNSSDTITRALRELLNSGLLIETRKGARPNRAAWYALAWFNLDQKDGIDFTPATFTLLRATYHAPLAPKIGADAPPIAPKAGELTAHAAPKSGAIGGNSASSLHRISERI